MEGLLRLGPVVWIDPNHPLKRISSIVWVPVDATDHELRIYHPDAEQDYFIVDRGCVFDVITRLGIERPPAAKSG
jgi:hypothetical protein